MNLRISSAPHLVGNIAINTGPGIVGFLVGGEGLKQVLLELEHTEVVSPLTKFLQNRYD